MKKRINFTPQGRMWSQLRAGWSTWWLEKAPVLGFGLKFTLFFLVLYVLLSFPQVEYGLYINLKADAWLANVLLNLLGQATHVSDVVIRSPAFAIAVRRGCDAIEPSWLLGAAILAFPSPWKAKLIGVILGTLILQLLNIVRIVSLFWIGAAYPAIFSTVHLELWPAFFVLAAILFFSAWKGALHNARKL